MKFFLVILLFLSSVNIFVVDAYSQSIAKEEQIENVKLPIVFVPGVMASRLRNNSNGDDSEVWPAMAKSIFDPWDSHIEQLYLKSDGITPENSKDHIYPSETLKELNFGVYKIKYYSPFIDYMKNKGFQLNEFPYDWRLDINKTIVLLDDFINQICVKNKVSQVDILSHSMGGAVSRCYVLSSASRAKKIRNLISAGTPYLGTPRVVEALRWGDPGMTFLWGLIDILDRSKTRKLLQNAPGPYQLLPSFQFYNVSGGKIYKFRDRKSVV